MLDRAAAHDDPANLLAQDTRPGVIGFGQTAALAFAAGVDAGPVEEPAALPGLVAGHSRHGHPPEPFPETTATGVWPRRAQVRAFGGRRDCPASSSKQRYAPVAAASLEA
jgi:hypothetical protein